MAQDYIIHNWQFTFHDDFQTKLIYYKNDQPFDVTENVLISQINRNRKGIKKFHGKLWQSMLNRVGCLLNKTMHHRDQKQINPW